MARKGSYIFVINIIFGLCIGDLWTLNAIRVDRNRASRRIPIRPLDRTTMLRLQSRPTELNPDAESIFAPNHITNPSRPLQIMERISVPVDWNHPSSDKFNLLAHDPYAMKAKYMSTSPVTDRSFHTVNQTADRNDARTSQSQYQMSQSKNAMVKKPKKPLYASGGVSSADGSGMQMKDPNGEIDFYPAYFEHQNPATLIKHRMKLRPDPISRLPMNYDFYDQKKKSRLAYPPPMNFAPKYISKLHHTYRTESDETSNVHRHHTNSHTNQYKQNYFDDVADGIVSTTTTTTTTTIPLNPTTTLPPPVSQEHAIQSDATFQTISPTTIDINIPNESETIFHSGLSSKPEMYKFTIDDVVIKPQPQIHSFNRPSTLPPAALIYPNNAHATHAAHYVQPSNTKNNNYIVQNGQNKNNYVNYEKKNTISGHKYPVNPNAILDNRFETQSYRLQLNYPPSPYGSQRLIYRRPEPHSYKIIPLEGASPPLLHQQPYKYPIDPIEITTPISLSTTEKTIINNKTNANSISSSISTISMTGSSSNNDITISDIVKPVYESTQQPLSHSKYIEKHRNRKYRRQNPDAHNKNEARKLLSSQYNQYGMEFSNSYTKQRTQGYNSEEELATTPVSPSKNFNLLVKHDNVPIAENITAPIMNSENYKHYQ